MAWTRHYYPILKELGRVDEGGNKLTQQRRMSKPNSQKPKCGQKIYSRFIPNWDFVIRVYVVLTAAYSEHQSADLIPISEPLPISAHRLPFVGPISRFLGIPGLRYSGRTKQTNMAGRDVGSCVQAAEERRDDRGLTKHNRQLGARWAARSPV